jgi:hypothetical protein
MEITYKEIIFGGNSSSLKHLFNNYKQYVSDGSFNLKDKMDILGKKGIFLLG